MNEKQKKKLAKRGIKKGYRTLAKIIEFDIVNSAQVDEINKYANLLRTANSYLDKAFNNG